MKNIFRQIIITLTKNYIQLLIAIMFSILTYYKLTDSSTHINNIEFKEIIIILTSIASILALITSITFAFVMSNMNTSNNKVESLFIEFKNFLFKTDDFLEPFSSNISIVEEARIISYNLKQIENDDIPLDDWDERLEAFILALDKKDEFEGNPNLGEKILEYLGHLEYLLNEIGILRINQIITGTFIQTLFKGFVLLSLMIISVLFLLVYHQDIEVSLMVVFPIFFGTLTSLLILEIGWWIKRQEDEMMSFIEDEETPNKNEETNNLP